MAKNSRLAELKAAGITSPAQLPLPDYDRDLPGDPAPVTGPAYRYRAWVVGLYDSDTMILHIDMGFHFVWQFRKIRLAGVNAFEITRKGGTTKTETSYGYAGRDVMLHWLGVDSATVPRKAIYHWLPEPVEVVVETIKDDSGKYGRALVVMWREGKNLNQWLARAGFAEITWYDGEVHPPDAPIFPYPMTAEDRELHILESRQG